MCRAQEQKRKVAHSNGERTGNEEGPISATYQDKHKENWIKFYQCSETDAYTSEHSPLLSGTQSEEHSQDGPGNGEAIDMSFPSKLNNW